MLSVVIVNWNTRDLLRGCLRSLAEYAAPGGQEVIVVDNASRDGSADMVRQEFPDVHLIANAQNLGYAAGNNQGIRAAAGQWVLLLNPDTEVRPGALALLIEDLAAHSGAAAVAPRLVGTDGRPQASVRGFPSPGALLAEAVGLAALFPHSRALGGYRMRHLSLDREAEVDQPMMSCLLVRRAALDEVGLLDEAFPIFFNDVDWCYRAKAAGWTIRFVPQAEVLHYGGASTAQVRGQMLRESGRSLARFYRKHYRGRLSLALYWLCLVAIEVGTWARCLAFRLRGAAPGGAVPSGAVTRPEEHRNAGFAPVLRGTEGVETSVDVVVSIVNWNTRDDLATCLQTLYERNSNPPTYVAAVVDNASSDGSADMVAERFPAAVLVRNLENRGFGAAHNQVMKGSDSRYVFVLNPDAETKPGALGALVRYMDEHPDVGICGPLVLNPDGTVQYSARRFPSLLAGAFRNTVLGRLFPNNRYTRDYLLSDWDHRTERTVDWVSGTAMMIRREVIERVGVFDEQFFMYSEDVDLCYRAGQAGWRVAFYPGATVVHARAHSSDKAPVRMLIQFHRSMYRFWRKHCARQTPMPLRALVPACIVLRCGLQLLKNVSDRLRARLHI